MYPVDRAALGEQTREYQIGKYGRMTKCFFKENHRGVYSYMLLSETLWKHLAEIDVESNEMFGNEENKPEDKKTSGCRIFDWRADKSILYESMKKQEG